MTLKCEGCTAVTTEQCEKYRTACSEKCNADRKDIEDRMDRFEIETAKFTASVQILTEQVIKPMADNQKFLQSLVMSNHKQSVLDRVVLRQEFVKALKIIGIIVGVCLSAYTGIKLSDILIGW